METEGLLEPKDDEPYDGLPPPPRSACFAAMMCSGATMFMPPLWQHDVATNYTWVQITALSSVAAASSYVYVVPTCVLGTLGAPRLVALSGLAMAGANAAAAALLALAPTTTWAFPFLLPLTACAGLASAGATAGTLVAAAGATPPRHRGRVFGLLGTAWTATIVWYSWTTIVLDMEYVGTITPADTASRRVGFGLVLALLSPAIRPRPPPCARTGGAAAAAAAAADEVAAAAAESAAAATMLDDPALDVLDLGGSVSTGGGPTTGGGGAAATTLLDAATTSPRSGSGGGGGGGTGPGADDHFGESKPVATAAATTMAATTTTTPATPRTKAMPPELLAREQIRAQKEAIAAVSADGGGGDGDQPALPGDVALAEGVLLAQARVVGRLCVVTD